ncbi:hypothetical protein EIN_267990 [Entamoeba invadens IP1]|uniref:Uncharacterized protein n=1 Tax=Entamoeba invadens IP1 TaxID=370355 RepID=A0A0A1U838_ENTIV|nr:hypothetical protein EIN_267990 [Entamoeba invadens IP1]ELP91063.1 hypothetical protein EIN_267990 [Entamoeba invadens IP1]|eukprot:XP_004257834.1 hypothetical protein EIN_267990 [Entamoeba invadens IP1]
MPKFSKNNKRASFKKDKQVSHKKKEEKKVEEEEPEVADVSSKEEEKSSQSTQSEEKSKETSEEAPKEVEEKEADDDSSSEAPQDLQTDDKKEVNEEEKKEESFKHYQHFEDILYSKMTADEAHHQIVETIGDKDFNLFLDGKEIIVKDAKLQKFTTINPKLITEAVQVLKDINKKSTEADNTIDLFSKDKIIQLCFGCYTHKDSQPTFQFMFVSSC